MGESNYLITKGEIHANAENNGLVPHNYSHLKEQ